MDTGFTTLQTLVAIKHQNSKWYRGGRSDRNNLAWRNTTSTGTESQTLMVWQIESEFNYSTVFSGDQNEDTNPYNSPVNVDIDAKTEGGEFRGLSGTLDIQFNDKGDPDAFSITYQTSSGPQTLNVPAGNLYDDSDNVQSRQINLSQLTSSTISVSVTNPTGHVGLAGMNRNGYTLNLTVNGGRRLNAVPVMHYDINKTTMLHKRKS